MRVSRFLESEIVMIPKKVIEAARGRIDAGGTLCKVNRRGNKDVYTCVFPEDSQVTIGLPEIYLWDGSKVEIIVGEVAFEFTV